MPQCITCGCDLHPQRAEKYNYCMAPGCQEKNAKGLTMVAVGVNKAAEQYMILDEQTREELASGKYHDQRRGSFGQVAPGGAKATAGPVAAGPVRSGPRQAGPRRPGPQRPGPRRPASRPAGRRPWSTSQERLALLYNAQGLRPDEIARKLRLSPYTVTQIILTSRSQGKL
jgi:DNA-binding CsgD family transcriptional regulator